MLLVISGLLHLTEAHTADLQRPGCASKLIYHSGKTENGVTFYAKKAYDEISMQLQCSQQWPQT